MRAGQLDRRITLESRFDTVNSVGQPIPLWSTFAAQVPSSYEPLRGREFFAAQQLTAVEPALFRIRYRAGVVPTMRVRFEDKIWDIAAVEEGTGRHREMRLYCMTGLTEG